jgi:acetate kinase
VDVIIFTGGVGERMPILREQVCSQMEALGIKMNLEEKRPFHRRYSGA